MKYARIKDQRDSYSIQTMCSVLAVSKIGLYKWLSPTPIPRVQRSEAIKADVPRVYESYSGIYGSAEITQELRNSEELETSCRNTVAKAMKEMGLKGLVSN